MRARKVTVRHALHNEFRAMTNGVAAFATATLLIFLQGNFGELDEYSVIALFFFTAAVPICISASFISFLFSQRTHIPAWADNSLDWIVGAGWLGGIGGLGALLLSASGLLAIIYGVSIGVSFLAFVFIVHAIGMSDSQSCAEEPSENRTKELKSYSIESKES